MLNISTEILVVKWKDMVSFYFRMNKYKQISALKFAISKCNEFDGIISGNVQKVSANCH